MGIDAQLPLDLIHIAAVLPAWFHGCFPPLSVNARYAIKQSKSQPQMSQMGTDEVHPFA